MKGVDEEELTEQIVEKIIDIIEECSTTNDYGDEYVYLDDVLSQIKGWYGL